MPRFFLHIETGDGRVEDPDGSDLPDLNAAHVEALELARYLLSLSVAKGRALDGRTFHICDAAGNVLLTVPFIAALVD